MIINKTNKIIGYLLLFLGLLIIILSLYQTYNVILGKYKIPQIFHNINFVQPNKNIVQDDFQKQVENALIKVVPLEMISDFINLFAWVLLISVIMFGGKHLAYIGIKMIKTE